MPHYYEQRWFIAHYVSCFGLPGNSKVQTKDVACAQTLTLFNPFVWIQELSDPFLLDPLEGPWNSWMCPRFPTTWVITPLAWDSKYLTIQLHGINTPRIFSPQCVCRLRKTIVLAQLGSCIKLLPCLLWGKRAELLWRGHSCTHHIRRRHEMRSCVAVAWRIKSPLSATFE